MNTIGIHPKVIQPTIAGVVVGVALLITALLLHDGDLKTAGLSVLLAAIGYGGIGYRAPAAPVTEEQIGPANDDLLEHHDKVMGLAVPLLALRHAADLSVLFVFLALGCGIAAAVAAWRGAEVPAIVLIAIAVLILIFGV